MTAERDKLRDAADAIVLNADDIDGLDDRCSISYEHLNDLIAALSGTGPSEADKLREINKELLAACEKLEIYARVQTERHSDSADFHIWDGLLAAIAKARGEG